MSDLRELEARVAVDRLALTQSLDALSAATDPTAAADHVSKLVKSYGGEIGEQAWSVARRNPAAFALVGAGLGLLLTGAGNRAPKKQTLTEDDIQAVPPKEAMVGFDERVAAADAAIKEEHMTDSSYSASASKLRATMKRGLDALPGPARDRVIKARAAAIDAQEKVEAEAKKIARQSKGYMQEQPLVVGAFAVGIGALVGALLPSTRREDQALGAHRDALMKKAHDALAEELERVHVAATVELHAKASDVTDRIASASRG